MSYMNAYEHWIFYVWINLFLISNSLVPNISNLQTAWFKLVACWRNCTEYRSIVRDHNRNPITEIQNQKCIIFGRSKILLRNMHHWWTMLYDYCWFLLWQNQCTCFMTIMNEFSEIAVVFICTCQMFQCHIFLNWIYMLHHELIQNKQIIILSDYKIIWMYMLIHVYLFICIWITNNVKHDYIK